jgi:hypothetical protein
MMPTPDPNNSEQNAFVQDWLNKWDSVHPDPDEGPEDPRIMAAIEEIQGTYNYEDHGSRKKEVDYRFIKVQLEQFMEDLMAMGAPAEFVDMVNQGYAAINSVVSHMDSPTPTT